MGRAKEPLRELEATAPDSGGAVWLRKHTDLPNELSFGVTDVTAVEFAVFWRCKLKAERGGIENWQAARQVLLDAGWSIERDEDTASSIHELNEAVLDRWKETRERK